MAAQPATAQENGGAAPGEGRSLASLVRTDNWLGSKIPPLLAVGYAMILSGGADPLSASATLLLLLASIFCVAAYGHIVNDIFDIDQDLANGKRNAAAVMSPLMRAGSLSICVALGFAPLLALHAGALPALLLALNYLLPTVYSIPPLRLKERGVAGIVADALGAHAVPTLFVVFSWGSLYGRPGGLFPALAASAFLWAFFAGLRGIVTHQVGDCSEDRQTGVVTFVGTRRRKALRRMVLCRFYPLELVGIVVFVALLAPRAPVLAGTAVVFLLAEFAKLKLRWKLPLFYPEHPTREPYWPLVNNEFYEVWLPCSLALQLSFRDPAYLGVTVVHLLLFRRGIAERGRIMATLAVNVRDQIKIRMRMA